MATNHKPLASASIPRMPVLRRVSQFAVALALGVLALANATQAQDGHELVDRILAVVDDDPILQSDIDRLIALDPTLKASGLERERLDQRLLSELIDQRLRSHEVERYGFGDVPQALVDKQERAIEERFGSPAALDSALAGVGWTRRDLRIRLQRQLAVLTYVDELLGARVFVGIEEIQQHYDTVLIPELRQKGLEVPPLEEVREPIRELLRQERLNAELGRWTEELRAKADILNYFEREGGPLPALVEDTTE